MSDDYEPPCAVIRINSPGAMTPKGREDIAQWLRRSADQLVNEGDQHTNYSFWRAKYFGDRD